jgi:radical SAM superfamily enzyme YgiQ (UPF0313 family)
MRVLLVNPSQEHFITTQKGWSLGLRDVGYYQPLGILYVATCLIQKLPDVQVKVIDAASPDMPYSRLQKIMKAYRPDVVGISTYTHTFVDALTVSRITKSINPEIHVTLGGHHLSYFPHETLVHESVDSIIVGEGELKFTHLIEHLQSGLRVEDVDGVFTRRTQGVIDGYGRRGKFLDNVEQLPYPNRRLVEDYSYYNMLTLDRKMTTIISSRGCPYDCNFCAQGREPYRPRTAMDVVEEMLWCYKQGFSDFFFVEDTFNISNTKVAEFCNALMSRNLEVGWCCKARIHGMDYDTLMLMKKAGCYLINFGVETGTDEGLRNLQKGTTTAEIKQVFEWCKQIGIQTMAYFMIGHPFEKSHEDVFGNLKFLMSLNPDYCNINLVNPIPFTPLFDQGVEKGILDYTPWRRMVLRGEMFTPGNWEEHFSKDQLQALRNRALLKFFFRPAYILSQLENLANGKQLWYKTKVALSMLAGALKIPRRRLQ